MNPQPSEEEVWPPNYFPDKIKRNSSKPRIRWLDQSRGFVIVLLILSMAFPPPEWKQEGTILFFLFSHPPVRAPYMTFYDVGAMAFIFLIGISTALSIQFPLLVEYYGKIIRKMGIRYLLITLLGYILLFNQSGWIIAYSNEEETITCILNWNMFLAIGIAGLIAIPWLFIEDPKVKLICAYLWLGLYQILLLLTRNLKEYAYLSVHGGFFGTLFGFTAVLIIGVSLGQIFTQDSSNTNKDLFKLLITAILNFGCGLGFQLIPGCAAEKALISLSYVLISIGMILFFIFGFMWIDLKFNWNLIFLKIYGRYSLLAFLGVGMLFFILTQFFEPDLGMGPWGTLVTEFILFSISGIFLTVVYRKKLKISTEKVTITYIIIGSVLLLISSVN